MDRTTRKFHDLQVHDRANIHRQNAEDPSEHSYLQPEASRWDRRQRFDLGQRLEWLSFDWRMRRLSDRPQEAPDLGIVVADDTTIGRIADGSVLPGEHWDLLWPRWPVYGRVLRELREQQARSVAFDVLMPDRRYSEDAIQVAQPGPEPGTLSEEPIILGSDQAFGAELAAPGAPAFLAVAPDAIPISLFHTNAARLGDVVSPQDADGVARRVRAFTRYQWLNPRLLQDAAEKRITLRLLPDNRVRVADMDTRRSLITHIDPDGSIRLNSGPDAPRFQVYETSVVWHLGIVMAAAHLGLDLDQAEIQANQVKFTGPKGMTRTLPVDAHGYFHVAWQWNVNQTNLVIQQNLMDVLNSSVRRGFRLDDPPDELWKDRTVLIGSFASGNNLADRGATPLDKSGFLVTLYLNVANMLLQDRYLVRTPLYVDMALIVILGLLSMLVTWRLPTALSPVVLLGIAAAWNGIASLCLTHYWLWIPVAYPILSGLALPYLGLMSYRVMFEQKEQQRIRSLFSKMVSPDIVHEVLQANAINLGGARREVTVFFADIRGFTSLTDRQQSEVEQFVRENQLDGPQAEALFEDQARRVLETVNLYLATIADLVKLNHGTLDKYIGDCVMAFWGAPTYNPKHAVDAVKSAIEAQIAIDTLNQNRIQKNLLIEEENRKRASNNQPLLSLLPTLQLGTGINTGIVTVGLMGSDSHIVNYTVFGREVNLASRLETVSGHSRIVIGENTFRHVERFSPDLAKLCIELPPVEVKGMQEPIRTYEVNWKEADNPGGGG